MCGEKNFNEERIRNGCKKLVKARGTTTQGRLDSFFKVMPSPTNNDNKRKVRISGLICYLNNNIKYFLIVLAVNVLIDPWSVLLYRLIIINK